MTGALKKVKSGDALVIPAQTFNTFIDAASDFRSRQQGRAQTAQQRFRSSGIILIKNVSGYDWDRFAAMRFRAATTWFGQSCEQALGNSAA